MKTTPVQTMIRDYLIQLRFKDRTYDLVYSPDDGGWYLECWDSGHFSQTFDTKTDALNAISDGTARFTE
jgi:hypothetical protein